MPKELIYVGDPMCSWCWGFSPVLRALAETCAGRASVTLIAGGLRPGNTELMDDRVKAMLRGHWQEVEKRTGQNFNYGLFERDDFTPDTEPGCRAMVTARELAGNARALDAHEAIQRAFYIDNRDVTDTAVLARVAGTCGFDEGEFKTALESEEMREKTLRDFQLARRFGVTGFPTVLINDSQGYAYLTVGYRALVELAPVVAAWLDDRLERTAAE